MYGYVYITTNKLDNKIYIGQHKASKFDESYFGSGKLFQKVFKKYGKSNFSCQILQWCDTKQELDEKEKFYIKLYDSQNPAVGYNLADGGNSWDCGYHIGMLGKKQSEHQRKAVSNALKGVKKSEEARQHMSISKIGNSNAKNGAGKKFINNGTVQIRVRESDIPQYLECGYQVGKLKYSEEQKERLKLNCSDMVYIFKDDLIKRVHQPELNQFLNDGWAVGRPRKNPLQTGAKISKAKKGSKCITDGVRNYYVLPAHLDQYKNKGFYFCSLYKYNKYKLEEKPREFMENLLIK